MTETDETYQALPAELAPPDDPTDELEAVDEEEAPFLAAGAPTPAPLGRTPAYDFVAQRFVPGSGGALMLYGIDSLAQWIHKALITAQGAAPAVDPNFGIASVNHLLDGGPFDASAAAELEDMVRTALRVHPRITDIDEWNAAYQDGDDAVLISFKVMAEGDDQIEAQELAIDDFPIPLGG